MELVECNVAGRSAEARAQATLAAVFWPRATAMPKPRGIDARCCCKCRSIPTCPHWVPSGANCRRTSPGAAWPAEAAVEAPLFAARDSFGEVDQRWRTRSPNLDSVTAAQLQGSEIREVTGWPVGRGGDDHDAGLAVSEQFFVFPKCLLPNITTPTTLLRHNGVVAGQA